MESGIWSLIVVVERANLFIYAESPMELLLVERVKRKRSKIICKKEKFRSLGFCP